MLRGVISRTRFRPSLFYGEIYPFSCSYSVSWRTLQFHFRHRIILSRAWTLLSSRGWSLLLRTDNPCIRLSLNKIISWVIISRTRLNLRQFSVSEIMTMRCPYHIARRGSFYFISIWRILAWTRSHQSFFFENFYRRFQSHTF